MGHILFDPLKYEALKFIKKTDPSATSEDAIRTFLRSENNKGTTKKPCKSYDYDDTLCKLLGDRALCGYNKNVGKLEDSTAIIDIGDGCFIRGDRIECGYVFKPFVYIPRPHVDTEINTEESLNVWNPFNTKPVSRNEATESLKTTKTETTNESTTETEATKTKATTTKRTTVTEATKTEATTERSTVAEVTEEEKGAPQSSIGSHNYDTNKNEIYKDYTIRTTIKPSSDVITTTICPTLASITTPSIPTITTTTQSTSTKRYKPKCVEKEDHLFCYDV